MSVIYDVVSYEELLNIPSIRTFHPLVKTIEENKEKKFFTSTNRFDEAELNLSLIGVFNKNRETKYLFIEKKSAEKKSAEKNPVIKTKSKKKNDN